MRRDNVDLVEKPFPVQMVNQTWFASTLSHGEAAFGRIVINLLEAGDVKHIFTKSFLWLIWLSGKLIWTISSDFDFKNQNEGGFWGQKRSYISWIR